MNLPEVKIMGIQRSGNNWLNSLFKRNYHVRLFDSTESGWKHGKYDPTILGREVNLVIICKHPLCWLPSIWRYRGQQKEEDFNRYVRQNPGEVEYWNEMHRHYLDLKLKTRKKFIVQYEELLDHPIEFCVTIAHGLGLQRSSKSFYVPRRRMTTKNFEGTKPFFPAYYLHQLYIGEFSSDALREMNARIDWSVVQKLGYVVAKEPVGATR